MADPTTTRRTQRPGAPVPAGRSPAPRNPLKRWAAAGGLLVLLALAGLAFFVFRTGADSSGADSSGADSSGALSVLQTDDFHALTFSPTEANVVYFGHHNGIQRSGDGGRTWRPLVERRNFDAMSLAVSGGASPQMFLAGHDIFQSSADGGATWQPVRHNLPGTDIHGFALNPDDAKRLTAFVVGSGVLQSADGGQTWQQAAGTLPGDIHALASAGGAPETLLAGSMQSGILRSTDGGKTWAPSSKGLPAGVIATLAVDPAARQTVYAGGQGGLFKSADGGATWSKLPFPGANAVAVAVSPAQAGTVLAITVRDEKGLVFRSADGGQTWGAAPR